MNEDIKKYDEYRHAAEQYAYQGLVVSLVLLGIATSKEMKLAGFNIADGGLHNGYVAAFGGGIVALAFARFYLPFREAKVLRNLLAEDPKLKEVVDSPTGRFHLRAPFSVDALPTITQKFMMLAPFLLFALIQTLFTIWLFFFFTAGGKPVSWWDLLLLDWDGFNANWKFQQSAVYLNTPFHTWIQLALNAWMVRVTWNETRALPSSKRDQRAVGTEKNS